MSLYFSEIWVFNQQSLLALGQVQSDRASSGNGSRKALVVPSSLSLGVDVRP